MKTEVKRKDAKDAKAIGAGLALLAALKGIEHRLPPYPDPLATDLYRVNLSACEIIAIRTAIYKAEKGEA